MDTTDVLLQARDLISDPQNWNQGSSFNEDGTKMCARQALAQASDKTETYIRTTQLLDEAAEELHNMCINIIAVNDHLGHDAVMETYDLAIRKSKDQEDQPQA